jgi:cysteine desulfurase
MAKVMHEDYENPSSTHTFGRHATHLELSRKAIAKAIGATSQEIIFTSGGTESNNWIVRNAVTSKCSASSPVRTHAVLHSVEALQHEFGVAVLFVNIKPNGEVDLTHLVELLSDLQPTLVSLMHVNNETGAAARIGGADLQTARGFFPFGYRSIGGQNQPRYKLGSC